jgi:hypothetical protein
MTASMGASDDVLVAQGTKHKSASKKRRSSLLGPITVRAQRYLYAWGTAPEASLSAVCFVQVRVLRSVLGKMQAAGLVGWRPAPQGHESERVYYMTGEGAEWTRACIYDGERFSDRLRRK